jgi:hypothetical protein
VFRRVVGLVGVATPQLVVVDDRAPTVGKVLKRFEVVRRSPGTAMEHQERELGRARSPTTRYQVRNPLKGTKPSLTGAADGMVCVPLLYFSLATHMMPSGEARCLGSRSYSREDLAGVFSEIRLYRYTTPPVSPPRKFALTMFSEVVASDSQLCYLV